MFVKFNCSTSLLCICNYKISVSKQTKLYYIIVGGFFCENDQFKIRCHANTSGKSLNMFAYCFSVVVETSHDGHKTYQNKTNFCHKFKIPFAVININFFLLIL